MRLVNKASGFDEFNGVESASAAIALVSASVFISTMRANSFHKAISQKLGASLAVRLLLVLL